MSLPFGSKSHPLLFVYGDKSEGFPVKIVRFDIGRYAPLYIMFINLLETGTQPQIKEYTSQESQKLQESKDLELESKLDKF